MDKRLVENHYYEMTVKDYKNLLQNALDIANRLNDDDLIDLQPNTVGIRYPFIGTNLGFVSVRQPNVKEDGEDFDESMDKPSKKRKTMYTKINRKEIGESKATCNNKINIKEALNAIDRRNCNKYDLLNTYNSTHITESKKEELVKLLASDASAIAIHKALNRKN